MGRAFVPHIITPDSALGGKVIGRSVRCGDGGAFTRTPSVTGNQKVWTWSAWVKKWGQGGTHHLFSSEGNNDGIAAIYFNGDNIHTYFDTSGSNPYGAINSREHRDPNSWMHIVWQVDALNQTQSIWINGQDESPTSSNNPPNFAYSMNQSGKVNGLGISAYGGSHTNGTYLAEVHHSDGYKYDPSYYGYTDPQTGIWRPKKVTGISYGTNGFYLDFSDNSTAAALGKDRSGNGNDWTPNGSISVANNDTNDSLLDSPTNNFCTLNPLRRQNNNCTLSMGNLKATGPNESYPGATGNITLFSGKWYYEFVMNTYANPGSDPMCGICRNSYISGGAGRIVYRAGGHYITATPSEPSDPDAFAVGDIIGVAIDLDDAAGKIRFYKNGSLQPILANGDLDDVKSDLSISTLGGVYPYVQMYNGDVCTVNFGQRPFSYTPPSGHKKLTSNTNNNSLDNSTPSILDPKEHFNTLLWTGNGSASRDITGLEFKPDLVWIKRRANAQAHSWQDSVIGFGDDKTLRTENNNALDTNGNLYGYINYTLKDGININGGTQASGNDSRTNAVSSNNTYVAWCWKAGGSSNTFNVDGKGYASASAAGITDGNLPLTAASINRESGFSIVRYTGNGGSSQTLAHGLGIKPKIFMTKCITDGSTNWDFHAFETVRMDLNNVVVNQNNSLTSFTNDYLTIASGSDNRNGNAKGYVAYIWAEIPGYSKLGTFTGNGNSDGTFVYTGFRPSWVMTKTISGNTSNWNIYDHKRNPHNIANRTLYANLNNAESAESASGNQMDLLSNGFKMRGNNQDTNGDGSVYIYMAFAKQPGGVNPFKTSANAR